MFAFSQRLTLIILLMATFSDKSTFKNNESKISLPIRPISIPKAGTHLFDKLLKLIILENALCIKNNLDDNPYFYYPHLKYSEFNKDKLLATDWIKFFIYRDPRDQIVSLAFYLLKLSVNLPNIYDRTEESLGHYINQYQQGKLGMYPFDYTYFENKTLSEIIAHLIVHGAGVYDRLGGKILDLTKTTNGIKEFYDSYLPWMSVDGFCSIKFEDLVGSKGGGSDEIQISTIKKIIKHIGIELSDEEISKIAKNLFGESPTFREGQIGSWKKHFTEEHKRDFKKIAGQLLIDLGYEADLEW